MFYGSKGEAVYLAVLMTGCAAVPPRITRGPVSRTEVEGTSVTLQCRVVAAPYPDTVISWTKDGHLLDVSSPLSISARLNLRGKYCFSRACMQINTKSCRPIT